MEYRRGSKDKQVGIIQNLLNQARSSILRDSDAHIPPYWSILEVDNDFGVNTELAVKGFQEYRKITMTGIVGNTTWNYLSSFLSSVSAPTTFSGEYRRGSRGNAVLEIQRLLNNVRNKMLMDQRPMAWDYIAEDGVFGPCTENSVRCFQQYIGIKQEYFGVVGSTTLNYLKNPPLLVRQTTQEGEADALKIIMNAINSFSSIVLDFFTKELTKIEKVIRNIFQVPVTNEYEKLRFDLIKNNQQYNNYVRQLYIRLANVLSSHSAEFKRVSHLLKRWQSKFDEQKRKGSLTRARKDKLNRQIDTTIKKHFKFYPKSNLNVSKYMKSYRSGEIVRLAGRSISKLAPVYVLAKPLYELYKDYQNADGSEEWQRKWNKDFSNFLELVINTVISTIVSTFLASQIIVGTAVGGVPGFVISLLIALFVSFLVSWALELIRSSEWYQGVEQKIGAFTSRSLFKATEYVDDLMLSFNT